MTKDLGKYKVLDKLRVSLANLVICYREARKFTTINSPVLNELGKCYDQLESELSTIDNK